MQLFLGIVTLYLIMWLYITQCDFTSCSCDRMCMTLHFQSRTSGKQSFCMMILFLVPQHLGIWLKQTNADGVRTENGRCSQSSCNLLQSTANFGSSHMGLTVEIHSMYMQGSGYCHDSQERLSPTKLALYALQAFTVSVTWFLYVDVDDWIHVAQR